MNGIVYFEEHIGYMHISEENGFITRLGFGKGEYDGIFRTSSKTLSRACEQLDEYFSGQRKKFDLPIKISDSEFRVRVWGELCKIEYSKTVSYKYIAQKTGNPKACRAVGGAVHLNPIAIIIPCHRVIGSDGALVGFAGGIGIKKYLLDLEKKYEFA